MKVIFDMPSLQQRQEGSMSMLQKRYVNGEIIRKQFREIKKGLGF